MSLGNEDSPLRVFLCNLCELLLEHLRLARQILAPIL